MGKQLLNNNEAVFLRNEKGEVCIAFADPAYVRAEAIVLDAKDGSIHAILHENSHLVGHVSHEMAGAFVDNAEVLLCAVRSNGGLFELTSPLTVVGTGF